MIDFHSSITQEYVKHLARWPREQRGWFRAHRKNGLIPACAAMAACAGLVLPTRARHELSERAPLELFGAAWSSTLARYVLVSDEVNQDGSKYPPRLFALTEAGQLDAAPIPIDGIGQLDEPKSIAAAPDGTLFLSTSHGHLPQRRRLLHLSLGTDHEAHIIGQADLTAAQGVNVANGAAPWDDDRLELEGLAFRDGALYMGLELPQAVDGTATILRLRDAATVLSFGAVPAGALSVWASARFCAPRDGVNLCEGVTDLAFLPDGALLVAGSSQKSTPPDGGGSLWKFASPGSAPSLLKRFEGLTPEGVAISPDHASAIVVFDSDGRQPIWMRWPLSS